MIYKNSMKYQSFDYPQLNDQTVLFLKIQFNICLHSVWMSNSSIWPIDKTLWGATTPGQGEPGSNDNERVLHIPQTLALLELHH